MALHTVFFMSHSDSFLINLILFYLATIKYYCIISITDPIVQIVEDGIRHILYTRSEKGTLKVHGLIKCRLAVCLLVWMVVCVCVRVRACVCVCVCCVCVLYRSLVLRLALRLGSPV